jgi:protoporphyrinogen/coproporphyrinogen III oxidase
MSSRHVAVVGGGIAGLAAALFLARHGGDALRVTVLEASPRIGGKLSVSEVAGIPVDEGAEALLVRRPEGAELVRLAGLGDELVAPVTMAASVWSAGALRPVPSGHVMGVPGDLRALAASGLLSLRGLGRVPLDHLLPQTPVDDDVAIGRYVTARLGREVVDRLLEPLLGGVYAGHADELSLDATVPQLSQAVRSSRSLIDGVRRVIAANPGNGEPVFNALTGGMGRLPAAVAAASGAEVRTGTTVRGLRRTSAGWRLTTGPAREPEHVDADAVVLALPARPAGRLLADEVPAASAQLAGIDYASVAIVTLALPRSAFPRPLRGSGFLVPPVEGRVVKAVTYSSRKWGWLADADPDTVIVRLSIGRYGEEHDLQRTDQELAAAARAELADALGVRGEPIDTRVTRWGGSLPQYAIGHRHRVAGVRAAVAQVPGLAVCGAAYDGVGIPACVATARTAAESVLRGLGTRPVRGSEDGVADGATGRGRMAT